MVNDGTAETTYCVYDAAGQRVRKITERQNGSRKKERIYLGGFELYREYDGSGTGVTLERDTLHVIDDKQRIALVETRTQGSESASPEQLIRYQFGNHLGSASLELDDAGQVISYEEYYPYGSTSYQAGHSVAEVSLKRYRYTGMERDEETGFAYHGARYYAPWVGRWTSSDPVGVRGGENLYRYCTANPVVRIDHGGKEDEYCWTPGCGTPAPLDAIKDLVWGAGEGAYDAGKSVKEGIEQADEDLKNGIQKVIEDPDGAVHDFADMINKGGPGMLLYEGLYRQGEHIYDEYNAFEDALDQGKLRSAARIVTRNTVQIGVQVGAAELFGAAAAEFEVGELRGRSGK